MLRLYYTLKIAFLTLYNVLLLRVYLTNGPRKYSLNTVLENFNFITSSVDKLSLFFHVLLFVQVPWKKYLKVLIVHAFN